MLNKETIKTAINQLRIDKNVKVFIHNRVDYSALLTILVKMPCLKAGLCEDDFAHIITTTSSAVCYRTKDNVYIIPATAKAVVNNNDGKIKVWFDYPCEMKVEDLEEF